MKGKALALALVSLAVCSRAEDAPGSAARREHLKHLGGAIRAYGILHENKPPAKLSDLYLDGLADKLSDFVCPGSGTTITSDAEIDAKSDYTLEPLADAKDMIVREKNPLQGANTVLAIFADNSIKALPSPGGSTAAVTPATNSPTPAAKASAPPILPSPTADSGLVVVPNLAQFDSVSKMKAALEAVGLVGSFSAKGKPPSKALEFKFASQLPLAGTKAKPGTKVDVFIYQKFEETTAGVTTNPTTGVSATPANGQGEEVVVPNLALFDSVSKMKAALERVGLIGQFNAKGKPPTRALEFKFTSQVPVADTRVKRGSTVVVSIYQKFEESSGPATTYTPTDSSPPPVATAPPASSPGWVRRDSGDPTSHLEGAKWIGTWRGKVMRTGEPIAGSAGPNEEEYTLIRRRDGSEVWINGSTPLSYYDVGYGKIRFKMKNTTPPQYAELEQRGDHWAGRWVAGDKVLATFDLAPIPKPSWLSHM
jgi:hypothetical protein